MQAFTCRSVEVIFILQTCLLTHRCTFLQIKMDIKSLLMFPIFPIKVFYRTTSIRPLTVCLMPVCLQQFAYYVDSSNDGLPTTAVCLTDSSPIMSVGLISLGLLLTQSACHLTYVPSVLGRGSMLHRVRKGETCIRL